MVQSQNGLLLSGWANSCFVHNLDTINQETQVRVKDCGICWLRYKSSQFAGRRSIEYAFLVDTTWLYLLKYCGLLTILSSVLDIIYYGVDRRSRLLRALNRLSTTWLYIKHCSWHTGYMV
jgi:hypothetical protein